MNKFSFFEVDKSYVAFLKTKDSRIPDISYSTNDKFICGVLFEIDSMKYYAPISSFDKPQKSNILIKNIKGKATSSIRFSFMFPVPDELVHIKDFSKEKESYKRLLREELVYCNKNAEKIIDKANYIYEAVTVEKDPLMLKNCCDFKVLEKACIEYCTQQGLKLPETLKKQMNENPVKQEQPKTKSLTQDLKDATDRANK